MGSGYYRYPSLHDETVVFVCEDDLWTVPACGGTASRLTANLGEVSNPYCSPDGSQIAFIGREDGQPEVYIMPAAGGPARRLTFAAAPQITVAGWNQNGEIVFASSHEQPFSSSLYLYTIPAHGGQPRPLNFGPARSIAYGPRGAVVLGRNTGDPARWKRYRGGTAGQFWIDPDGSGNFHKLLDLPGNLASPMWLAERLYFLSDHEGVANLYSCLLDGTGLVRHTDHQDFYARNASCDARRIIYHAGADLYIYDPLQGTSNRIDIKYNSPQVQRSRRFVNPERYLKEEDIHPQGKALAVSVRSHVFSFHNWEGAVIHHGDPSGGARLRLPTWLKDGQRLLAVTDEGGEEAFTILTADSSQPPLLLSGLDIGRPEAVFANPRKDQVAFSNHRYQLCHLDLETRAVKVIDTSRNGPVSGFGWSPDGEWLVYSISISLQRSALKLWNAGSGEIHQITEPVLRDTHPVFDPHGNYIYFISQRVFDPVADNLSFNYSFPLGMKPYLITLQKETPDPFIPRPRLEEKEKEEKKESSNPPEAHQIGSDAAESGTISPAVETAAPAVNEPLIQKKGEEKITIDLEGIQNRCLAFPVKEGRYGRILGAVDNRVFYSLYPVEGTLEESWTGMEPSSKGAIFYYDLDEREEDHFLTGILDFNISQDGKNLLVRCGNKLRVVRYNFKPDSDDTPGHKSGWVDLRRLRVPVSPQAEWRQMFREIWRLQRDQFWNPEMSQVDWAGVYERYFPLVERVASRSEFSDLVWELQGELGTSHCYELGGDYRLGPVYPQGSLGAEFEFDEAQNGWRVKRIIQGDSWSDGEDSPLNTPGAQVSPGDVLLAVNGRGLSKDFSPAEALVNQANSLVNLTFAGKMEEPPRTTSVKTLGRDTAIRYREWVSQNRQRVHEATKGRAGYIHIPDMGPAGYAEFHRGYLAEVDYPALIVDIRYNAGGSVSSLLLEKLARRRLGYDVTRWAGDPVPYPPESVLGPMVAITNEHAGSDGDIFSHGFKLLKLGPLVGKRTWGGVVGIWPRHSLVDGTVTTQPEFSFWFKDVGWQVENYGTDPDIEVEITPNDYTQHFDAQLERAIKEVLRLWKRKPPSLPDLSRERPSRAAPKLPPR